MVFERIADVYTIRHPQDLEIVFPHENSKSLWASTAILMHVSPFFAQTFTNSILLDDSEHTPFASNLNTAAAPVTLLTPPKHQREAGTRRFTVYHAPFLQYKALLVWILTGYIQFAPMFRAVKADGTALPEATAAPRLVVDHTLTASAPHMARLAHHLDIVSLKELALNEIKSQLSPAHVLQLLFSKFCVDKKYGIHDVCFQYTVANWSQVRLSVGLVRVRERAQRGELGVMEATLDDLLRRRSR